MSAGSTESAAMQHCVDILTGGFVQSYVDFFFLLNKAAPGQMTFEGGEVADDDLPLIKEKLTGAEKAKRSGNPNAVFENYETLADQFSLRGDHSVAVHFLKKCLKLSQHFNDVEGEKTAMLKLGVAYAQISGMTAEAIESHERYLQLARQTVDEKACSEALRQLTKVYDRRSAELDSIDLSSSVVFLDKLLSVATENKDSDTVSSANFRLGQAYNRLHKPERAVLALTQSLEYAQQSGNSKAHGASCAALADAYLQMNGKASKAVGYLQETRQIAIQDSNNAAEAHACRMLGNVFSKSAEYLQAVNYLQQNFELVRKQGDDLREIERARILLGVALKDARKKQVHSMVKGSDVPKLLAWKVSKRF